MTLYNTTFSMYPATQGDFLDFMMQVYLPGLRANDMVQELRLHRIVNADESVDTVNYAVHFYCASDFHLQDILSNTALALAERLVERFGDRVIGFSTIMQTVDN